MILGVVADKHFHPCPWGYKGPGHVVQTQGARTPKSMIGIHLHFIDDVQKSAKLNHTAADLTPSPTPLGILEHQAF